MKDSLFKIIGSSYRDAYVTIKNKDTGVSIYDSYLYNHSSINLKAADYEIIVTSSNSYPQDYTFSLVDLLL